MTSEKLITGTDYARLADRVVRIARMLENARVEIANLHQESEFIFDEHSRVLLRTDAIVLDGMCKQVLCEMEFHYGHRLTIKQ